MRSARRAQKSPNEKVPALEPLDDLRDDQEAGDDEEDVDADKAAGHAGDADMVEHHREDRDGAQPVDERPVGGDIGRNDRSD